MTPNCFYQVSGTRLSSCNFSDLHRSHPCGSEPLPGPAPLLQQQHRVPVPRPEDRGAGASRVRAGGGRLQESPGQRGQPEPGHLRRVRGGEDGDNQVYPRISLQVTKAKDTHFILQLPTSYHFRLLIFHFLNLVTKVLALGNAGKLALNNSSLPLF